MKVTREDRKQLKKVLSGFQKRKRKETIFYDLCFTLCAPQTTFKNNLKVIAELKKRKFYTHDVINLPQICKPVRFYNNKARYLLEAKSNFEMIYSMIKDKHGKEDCGYFKRWWLMKNVKGMGMKASSHFLRNLGYDALAIIDTHIIKFLSLQSVADWQDEPTIESLSKKATTVEGYEDLEMWFQTIAGHMNLTTAELDALVWKNYSNTDWKEFKY